MIYLIKSYGIRGKSFLKIGFTNNIKNRVNQYFYMNPGVEIISTREGDELLESLLHFYLKFLGFQYKKNGKLNEWFLDVPMVYQIFHISRESLEKKIWKNREKVFNLSKISSPNGSNLEYDLFEHLWRKNKKEFEGEKIVFKEGKVIRTKAKKIDILFWRIYSNKNPDKVIILPPTNISPEYEKISQDFLDNQFYSTGIFREKMRMYCEFMDKHQGNKEIEDIIYFKIKDERFRKYYSYFGTKGCSSRKYDEKLMSEGMFEATKEMELKKAILDRFKNQGVYTLKEIKEGLGIIYRNLNITSKTPKSTDLSKYFNLTRARIPKKGESRKYSEGYKLESL